ncbi:hypothetical protein BEWA_009940 [Theileria equi strain WA]|uniref:Large ribosomal subunit protein mL49 n=1 Tax=Theileria equi strain WA TaxID=1537102 RepID=L0B179_THEEQ|nr:hypothetical protein BEWA_009940 [Theileria equi strain WA]AFZ81580.1 hypothetical protein BEWA_009940 [Theileria equi strain WA]|eukprot:XP_004831246.1 hypothetical protein BEWA_009940 [Theileria equi strain WA]
MCCFFGNIRHVWEYFPIKNQKRFIIQRKFVKDPEIKPKNLPFKVTRTPSGNLPVYMRIRAHGTVMYTVVRHIYGDVQAMKEQLRILCESPVRERIGSLEVQGIHVMKIKRWLKNCGQ